MPNYCNINSIQLLKRLLSPFNEIQNDELNSCQIVADASKITISLDLNQMKFETISSFIQEKYEEYYRKSNDSFSRIYIFFLRNLKML